ncbi:MAG: 30S ribosomal protein S1 [Verrucomicrobia bacterium]|nr:MAG: 30S ribosomal protein S1 [Verrucomicrobiota bacterium]
MESARASAPKEHKEVDTEALKGNQENELDALYTNALKQFEEGSIIKGRILEVREDGVLVDIGYKSEGVVPAYELEDLENIRPGDEIEVLVESLEDDDGMLVISKRKAEQKRNWERLAKEYREGDVIEGVIKSRVKGGLIVDVGVDAFLPGSQLDTGPVRDVGPYIGRRFEFKIIKMNPNRRNLVVSRRELIEERHRERKRKLLAEIQEGQIRKGVVKNITDFGAFIDLDGMDGLLHVTDMRWGRVGHPSEVLSVGQEVEVMVLRVDREKERISLGLKQKTPNPWEHVEERYPVGSRVKGRVVNLLPYGAFVELEDGVEGLIHVSEMSWTRRINRASEVLSVGDEVEAVVLSVNKQERKISLSLRHTTVNPWDTVKERYPIGARVKGRVRNFTSYGAFVELEEGVDGMIHVSDLSWTRKVNHPSEILQKDQMVEAVVLEVDPENRRISLGLKQAQEDPWATVGSRYQVGQKVKGRVVRLAPFGAFIELEPGVEGLVHVSEISDERVENVADVLQEGQEIEARVIRIDTVERRIGLSIRAAQVPDEEFRAEAYAATAMAGENLVDLGGVFEDVLGSEKEKTEEWRPGE